MFGDPYLFLVTAVFLIPAALIAIPVHELGHAVAANLQGDPSPRNRLLHRPDLRTFIEPYGLLAVFLLKVSWSQPVPVNEQRLRGLGGRLAYALGGPVANLLVAVVFGQIVKVLVQSGNTFEFASIVQTPGGYLTYISYAIFFLNLSTFAFNLLPIPGLDGWRVLEAIFRPRNPRFFYNAWSRRREVWLICALAIFASSFIPGIPNLLAVVMIPFYAPASTLILGACVQYPGLAPCPPSGRF